MRKVHSLKYQEVTNGQASPNTKYVEAQTGPVHDGMMT